MLQGLPVYKRLYGIILLTTHSEYAEISLEKVENISDIPREGGKHFNHNG